MIYAIHALEENGELPQEVRDKCKAVFADYSPLAWFVDFNGTIRELTNLIWPDGDEAGYSLGAGVVVHIHKQSDYSGYASKELWEWLKVHLS